MQAEKKHFYQIKCDLLKATYGINFISQQQT